MILFEVFDLKSQNRLAHKTDLDKFTLSKLIKFEINNVINKFNFLKLYYLPFCIFNYKF